MEKKEHKDWYKIRSVKPEVKQAISRYCRDNGLTQATYLEKDRRIKDYLK